MRLAADVTLESVLIPTLFLTHLTIPRILQACYNRPVSLNPDTGLVQTRVLKS